MHSNDTCHDASLQHVDLRATHLEKLPSASLKVLLTCCRLECRLASKLGACF